jgi:hypothetical protein
LLNTTVLNRDLMRDALTSSGAVLYASAQKQRKRATRDKLPGQQTRKAKVRNHTSPPALQTGHRNAVALLV